MAAILNLLIHIHPNSSAAQSTTDTFI